MKQEIEHIQHVIEKDRLQMLKDFDDWWEQQSEQAVCHLNKKIQLISSISFKEQQRQLLEMKPTKSNGELSRQTTSSVRVFSFLKID